MFNSCRSRKCTNPTVREDKPPNPRIFRCSISRTTVLIAASPARINSNSSRDAATQTTEIQQQIVNADDHARTLNQAVFNPPPPTPPPPRFHRHRNILPGAGWAEDETRCLEKGIFMGASDFNVRRGYHERFPASSRTGTAIEKKIREVRRDLRARNNRGD